MADVESTLSGNSAPVDDGLQWQPTEEQWSRCKRSVIRSTSWTTVRLTVAFAAVIVLTMAAHFEQYSMAPDNFRKHIMVLVGGMCGLVLMAHLVEIVEMVRAKSPIYRIDQHGLGPVKRWPALSWDRIRGFELFDDLDLPGERWIDILSKNGHSRLLLLPRDSSADAIVQRLSRYTPIIEPRLGRQRPKTSLLCLGVVASAITGFGMARLFWRNEGKIEQRALWIWIAISFLGPGTWWYGLIGRKWKSRHRGGVVVEMNLVCATVALIVLLYWMVQSLPPEVFPPTTWPVSTRPAAPL